MTSSNDEIRQCALYYLSKRDHSQAELLLKLARKGWPRKAIESVLQTLKEAGYLNDVSFTENFILSKQRKGFGPLRIVMELKAKGIASELIAECMEIHDNAWLREAHNIWQKRFKGTMPRALSERAKQIRFLQYRGYTKDQIESILKQSHPE